MLSVVMLIAIKLSVVMLSVVMLSVVMMIVVILSGVMLSVVMIVVVMLSVIMLSVVAPGKCLKIPHFRLTGFNFAPKKKFKSCIKSQKQNKTILIETALQL
jgi:hypothetical protein